MFLIRLITAFLVAVVATAIISCSDSPSGPALESQEESSAWENSIAALHLEAELAALWLSGELHAPKWLQQKIREDLHLICSRFADSIIALQMPFVCPFGYGELQCSMRETTVDSLLSGRYHSWDNLNLQFGLDTFSVRRAPDGEDVVTLTFTEPLHPRRLAEAYFGTDGITGVFYNGTPADRTTLIPYFRGGQLYYYANHSSPGSQEPSYPFGEKAAIATVFDGHPRIVAQWRCGSVLNIPPDWSDFIRASLDCWESSGFSCSDLGGWR